MNANDPAFPLEDDTSLFRGMTIREHMALTLTAAIIARGNEKNYHDAAYFGVSAARALINALNENP